MTEIRDKVQSVFRDLVGDRANALRADHFPAEINTLITDALTDLQNDTEEEILSRDSIGFHLIDWNADAAFLVALLLYPEKFTREEIEEGIDQLLVHAPSHILEAARLAGYEPKNIFHED